MTTRPLRPLLEKKIGPLTFAMCMRAARGTLEMSQVEMAKRLGIARGTLCDIEKGRQLVSVSFAIKVAKKAGLVPEVMVEACLQDQLAKAKFKARVSLIAG